VSTSPLKRGVTALFVISAVMVAGVASGAQASSVRNRADPKVAAIERGRASTGSPRASLSASVRKEKTAGQNGCPSRGQLIDHGGPVETTPRVYVDFWDWTSDPGSEKPYLISFLNSIGGSSWLSTVTQYCASDQPALAGQWADTSGGPPRKPTDADIQHEGKVAARHFGIKSLFGGSNQNTQIVVALPEAVSLPSTHADDCAYHEQLGKNPGVTTGPYVVVTALPYLAGSDYATQCGAFSVNQGTRGALDGVSITEGHELAESITDPEANAWYDDADPGNELADKCAANTAYDIHTHGHLFAVPQLWSNAANGCVVIGSAPSSPTDVQAVGVNAHVDVSWTAPSDDGGTPITSWLVTAIPGSSTCQESGHTYCALSDRAGRTYSISVQASNAVGMSGESNTVKATPSSAQNCSFVGPYADLEGCDLSNAMLLGANLTGANLTGVNLSGANLTGSNLTNANISKAMMDDLTLTGADLFGANLTDSVLTGAVLQSCDLTDANLAGADLPNTDLEGVSSSGITSNPISLPTNWRLINGYLIGPNANLTEADLSFADLSNTDLSSANLIHANLADADVSNADLSKADLSFADLSSADLSGANVSRADLNTVIWFELLCTDGWFGSVSGSSCDNDL
jgi:uncharacterized protein YjbI with pentapeptide repeats